MGHYAGRHDLLGAAAGCAVGHYMYKARKEREREEAGRKHAFDSSDYYEDTRPFDQSGTQNTAEYAR